MSEKNVRLAKVSEERAMSEPRPEFTKTWHPFSHDEVRQATEKACEKLGWKIGEREYSIRPDSKCLAVWEVTNGGELDLIDGLSNRLVWRNAIDMTHSLAYGVAYKEMICSNLQLSETRSWVTFRKHTGRLTIEEISFYAEASLRTLIPRFKELQDWRESLRSRSISYEQASMLTVFAMKRGYLPPSRFESFWDKFDGSASLYKKDAMTLFAWQNANTELMKENNMLVQLHKQRYLHYFLKYEAPVLLSQSNESKRVNPQFAIDSGFKVYQSDLAEDKRLMKASSLDLREKWNEQQKAKKQEAKEKKEVQKIKKKAERSSSELTGATTSKKSGGESMKKKAVQKKTPAKKIKRAKGLTRCGDCGTCYDNKIHKKLCPGCGKGLL